jgi:hypothetical protein
MDRDDGTRDRWLVVLIGTFIAIKVGFVLSFALHGRWVMDEFLAASMPLVIPEGFYGAWDPVKTVLYVYVYAAARAPVADAMGAMTATRLAGFLLAAGTAAFVYRIALSIWRSRTETLLAVAVLFSFSNFAERSYRVRSDTVAVFFEMAALAALTRRDAGRREAILAGLSCGLAFASTQKAVYGLLAAGLAIASGLASRIERRQAAGELIRFAAGFWAVVLLYAVAFGGWSFPSVLRSVFLSPLDLAIHGADVYRGDLKKYVVQTLERNGDLWALGVGGVLLTFSRWPSTGRAGRRGVVAAAVIVALVFAHSQPWPYVFVFAAAAASLFATQVPLALVRLGVSRRTAWALVLTLCATSLPRNVRYLAHGDSVQRRTVREAESLLAPTDRYFDGTWMVVSRRHAGKVTMWDTKFVSDVRADASLGRFEELDATFAEHPRLVILNFRTFALGPAIRRYLDGSYVRVLPNLLLSGTLVAPGEVVAFVARSPGRYSLYQESGSAARESFLVDGRAVQGATFLDVGPHEVRVDVRSAARALLPEGVRLAGPLPARTPPENLFAGVYD